MLDEVALKFKACFGAHIDDVVDQKNESTILEIRPPLQEADAFGAESGSGRGSSLPESVAASICTAVKEIVSGLMANRNRSQSHEKLSNVDSGDVRR